MSRRGRKKTIVIPSIEEIESPKIVSKEQPKKVNKPKQDSSSESEVETPKSIKKLVAKQSTDEDTFEPKTFSEEPISDPVKPKSRLTARQLLKEKAKLAVTKNQAPPEPELIETISTFKKPNNTSKPAKTKTLLDEFQSKNIELYPEEEDQEIDKTEPEVTTPLIPNRNNKTTSRGNRNRPAVNRIHGKVSQNRSK